MMDDGWMAGGREDAGRDFLMLRRYDRVLQNLPITIHPFHLIDTLIVSKETKIINNRGFYNFRFSNKLI